jgi:hypothetical protein
VLGQSDLSGTVLTTTHQNQVRFLSLSTYLFKPSLSFKDYLEYFELTGNRRVDFCA